MDPTPDSFRALARSSPWRWRTLHLTRRGEEGSLAEAWVERPSRMRVLSRGREHWVEERRGSEVDASRVVLSIAAQPGLAPSSPATRPAGPGTTVWGGDLEPVRRPDGLVAVRPDDLHVDYDDPMWGDYTWVAMLDPVELSHHTDVADVRVEDRAGRPTWRAVVRPLEGYDPRCGCCPLLYSVHSERAEHGEDWTPSPGERYPTAYEVALDVQTGVVVASRGLDEAYPGGSFEVQVHAVDEDVSGLFVQRPARRRPWEPG